MLNSVKKLFKKTFLQRLINIVRSKKLIQQWEESAKLSCSPHSIKQSVIKGYARKFGTPIFVETGTCLGEMIYAVKETFNKIYSIELDEELYLGAKQLFSKYDHIAILHGDSKNVLKSIFDAIYEPTIFWLDAHYSGGITTKGEKDTPVMEELQIILNQFEHRCVILIDDARCFNGKNDYPTLETLRDFIQNRDPKLNFEVCDDIIRIHRL